jgi:hypothetical protein
MKNLRHPLYNPPPHSKHPGRNQVKKSDIPSLHPIMAKEEKNLGKCGTDTEED